MTLGSSALLAADKSSNAMLKHSAQSAWQLINQDGSDSSQSLNKDFASLIKQTQTDSNESTQMLEQRFQAATQSFRMGGSANIGSDFDYNSFIATPDTKHDDALKFNDYQPAEPRESKPKIDDRDQSAPKERVDDSREPQREAQGNDHDHTDNDRPDHDQAGDSSDHHQSADDHKDHEQDSHAKGGDENQNVNPQSDQRQQQNQASPIIAPIVNSNDGQTTANLSGSALSGNQADDGAAILNAKTTGNQALNNGAQDGAAANGNAKAQTVQNPNAQQANSAISSNAATSNNAAANIAAAQSSASNASNQATNNQAASSISANQQNAAQAQNMVQTDDAALNPANANGEAVKQNNAQTLTNTAQSAQNMAASSADAAISDADLATAQTAQAALTKSATGDSATQETGALQEGDMLLDMPLESNSDTLAPESSDAQAEQVEINSNDLAEIGDLDLTPDQPLETKMQGENAGAEENAQAAQTDTETSNKPLAQENQNNDPVTVDQAVDQTADQAADQAGQTQFESDMAQDSAMLDQMQDGMTLSDQIADNIASMDGEIAVQSRVQETAFRPVTAAAVGAKQAKAQVNSSAGQQTGGNAGQNGQAQQNAAGTQSAPPKPTLNSPATTAPMTQNFNLDADAQMENTLSDRIQNPMDEPRFRGMDRTGFESAAKVAAPLSSAASSGAGGGFSGGELTALSAQSQSSGSVSANNQQQNNLTQGQRFQNPIQVLGEQVVSGMRRGAAQGNDEVSIKLNPSELGSIQIKMESNRDGKLKAQLMFEKVETLEIFKQDTKQLVQLLQDSGLEAQSGDLSFNLQGQNDSSSNQQNLSDNGNGNNSSAKDADRIEDLYKDQPQQIGLYDQQGRLNIHA